MRDRKKKKPTMKTVGLPSDALKGPVDSSISIVQALRYSIERITQSRVRHDALIAALEKMLKDEESAAAIEADRRERREKA